MSTLTYTDRDAAAIEARGAEPGRKSFWTRLLGAIVNSQQRRAEREIARYLASRGGGGGAPPPPRAGAQEPLRSGGYPPFSLAADAQGGP
jgi:hypothetical protein